MLVQNRGMTFLLLALVTACTAAAQEERPRVAAQPQALRHPAARRIPSDTPMEPTGLSLAMHRDRS
jgi:hypothetical protein